ncbi:MAG: HAD hydrolase-like protein [Hyphomicrobiaceae bacterium]|nr:MAG: HAD hydrolase-like protein [Hyphomicrobiaceae bacterium]
MDVLVDLDGTLIDPKPGIIGSIQYALRRLGAPVPQAEELGWAIGPPLRATFPRLLDDPRATEDAVSLYRESYRNGAMFDAIVYDGVVEALDDLSGSGCRLIVATSKPHVFARPVLEHFGLAGRFSAVHGAELDGRNDSKIDLLAHVVACEGVVPSRAVMIGDREFDVVAAARNGIQAVGVTWGYGSVAELQTAGAAAICEAPSSLARTALSLLV